MEVLYLNKRDGKELLFTNMLNQQSLEQKTGERKGLLKMRKKSMAKQDTYGAGLYPSTHQNTHYEGTPGICVEGKKKVRLF